MHLHFCTHIEDRDEVLQFKSDTVWFSVGERLIICKCLCGGGAAGEGRCNGCQSSLSFEPWRQNLPVFCCDLCVVFDVSRRVQRGLGHLQAHRNDFGVERYSGTPGGRRDSSCKERFGGEATCRRIRREDADLSLSRRKVLEVKTSQLLWNWVEFEVISKCHSSAIVKNRLFQLVRPANVVVRLET